MIKRRTPNPIIPGSLRDRTGTTGILRRALAEIDRRFAGLRHDVLAIFRGIRVYEINEVRVAYGLTPDELAAVSQALQEALDRWIEAGRNDRIVGWWQYSEEAAQLGTAQTVANLANLSAAYATGTTLQNVVFSVPYRNRVAMAQVKSYEHWAGLEAEARSQLSQIIGRAVVDGKNPKAVEREIAERLDISRSRARQYAQTDITDTLRQARWEEADRAEAEYGLSIGMLWTSALLPTTRPTHASRNGKVYTSDQVRTFYSENGNRYNCHCAQTEALLDENGDAILTKGLKDKMKAEKAAWEAAQAGKAAP